jgi:hypothetical protein
MIGISDLQLVGFGLKSFAFQNLLLEDQINIRTGIVNQILLIHCCETIK